MLNISQERLVEFPFTIGNSVVKINGKPIILKVSHAGSSVFRNALADVQRMEESSDEEKMAHLAAEILNGHENLIDTTTNEPVDCDNKERLRELLLKEISISAQILDNAKKKRPWTLEPLSSTQESSDG